MKSSSQRRATGVSLGRGGAGGTIPPELIPGIGFGPWSANPLTHRVERSLKKGDLVVDVVADVGAA